MLMLFDSDLDEEDIEILQKSLQKSKKNEKCNTSEMNLMDTEEKEPKSSIYGEHSELQEKAEKKQTKRKVTSLVEEADIIHKKLKKEKKLNSRLERLLKIKNRRNKIPPDPKLSPLYSGKEVNWTSFEVRKDVKSTEIDSGIDSPISQSVISTCQIENTSCRSMPFNNETQESCVECVKSCSVKCSCTIEDSEEGKISNENCDIKVNTVSVNSTLYAIPTPDKIVAMDCEFVGVHPKNKSALGRCSVIDFYGNVLYDEYVKPDEPIMTYRTKWSGIRKRHLKNAIPFAVAHQQIWNLLLGKIIVGHALFNDFKVMKIQYAGKHVRDTASYKPLRALANLSETTAPKLKNLSNILLGRSIQEKEHCSVEDCKATLDLYKLVRTEWEQSILEKEMRRHTNNNTDILDQSEGEASDSKCDSKSYLSDEFWPQYLFPSN